MRTSIISLLLLLMISSLRGQEARILALGRIGAAQLDLANETVGGIGSGLAYDSATDLYLAVSDRGPGDGTIDYRPRFDSLRVKLAPANSRKLEIALEKTTLFRTAEGEPMTGLSPDVEGSGPPRLHDGRRCIDPEAIALAPDHTLYVSDEYGPFLYQFQRDGTMLRAIEPPPNYRARTTSGEIVSGEAKAIVSGRVPNHGFEGLALSPNGKLATLILQSGLIQDGGKSALYTRMLVIEVASGKAVSEFAYPLTDLSELNVGPKRPKGERVKQDDLGVCELTTLNDHQFLVLERDNHGANGSMKPKPPQLKCIYVVDLNDATNLLALPNQPYDQLPNQTGFRPLVPDGTVKPVQKHLLINFAQLPLASDGEELASKWEGIALTPLDSRGHRRMLVSCDNDFLTPTLQINGRSVVFSRAQQAVSTTFLLFDLTMP